MTTQTLSRVTLQTLENYRTAATQAVVAYRLGSHRLVSVVNGALENGVYPRTAKVARRATDRMNEVRGNVSDIVVKGIDQVAQRTEQAIELGADKAAAQVHKVVGFAAGIDNPYVANGLQTAVRLTMPGAKVALVVSSKVADGAQALVQVAGGKAVEKAVRKVAGKPARKVGVRTQRAVAPVARKAKAAVETTVKATARRVTKNAGKLAKAVDVEVAKAPRRARAVKKAANQAVAA